MAVSMMVVGKAASGKSTLIERVVGMIENEGNQVQVVSDRVLLERAVLEDVGGTSDENGWLHGEHSILIDGDRPEGSRQFRVKDGVLLNGAHESMVKGFLNGRGQEGITIYEYALGPDAGFPEEDLLQSGESLIAMMREFNVSDKRPRLVVEVEANSGVRGERNRRREDALDDETFGMFFPDGGELGLLGGQLPESVSYTLIENNGSDPEVYARDIEGWFEKRVRASLEGVRVNKERRRG